MISGYSRLACSNLYKEDIINIMNFINSTFKELHIENYTRKINSQDFRKNKYYASSADEFFEQNLPETCETLSIEYSSNESSSLDLSVIIVFSSNKSEFFIHFRSEAIEAGVHFLLNENLKPKSSYRKYFWYLKYIVPATCVLSFIAALWEYYNTGFDEASNLLYVGVISWFVWTMLDLKQIFPHSRIFLNNSSSFKTNLVNIFVLALPLLTLIATVIIGIENIMSFFQQIIVD